MNVGVGTNTNFGKIAKVLHTATVLHKGWEMDNYAWAVEFVDGTRAVLTTSHGSPYFADRSEFEKSIREAEESAASLRKLLEFIV